jgi:hypothetical protein
VAYVESYDDVAFWRKVLEEFEDDRHYFEVMLPSLTSLTKGKKMVLMNTLNTAELGKSMIACVDSDYDFLLGEATAVSRKVNRNRYIFQTYVYAIENYWCTASSLHDVCVQVTLNDRKMVDFDSFMELYSRIAYPLFLWSIWFSRQHDTHHFPMSEFNACIRINGVNLRNITYCLERMKADVTNKLAKLEARFPHLPPKIQALAIELQSLGVYPETTYLFVQGHHLLENVVMKLLAPVCSALRREREEYIRRMAKHSEQYRNEITAYRNSQSGILSALKKNSGYQRNYLYERLRKDIREFLRQ